MSVVFWLIFCSGFFHLLDLSVHSNAILSVFAIYIFLLHGQINVAISPFARITYLQTPETVTPQWTKFRPCVKTGLRELKTRESLRKRRKNNSGVYRNYVTVI